jgi:carbamoyltransferase
MEFGPRALGNRSILADPRDAGMRDRLNARVKKREEFRPFAPAVIAEEASRYFDIDGGEDQGYAAMLFVVPVRPSSRALLPAVTHVDGSARLQTVRKDDNPRFWAVLSEFGALTGIPVLLNTSFNVRGQPIVCTPRQAVETFVNAGLDALVIGNYLVVRRGPEGG